MTLMKLLLCINVTEGVLTIKKKGSLNLNLLYSRRKSAEKKKLIKVTIISDNDTHIWRYYKNYILTGHISAHSSKDLRVYNLFHYNYNETSPYFASNIPGNWVIDRVCQPKFLKMTYILFSIGNNMLEFVVCYGIENELISEALTYEQLLR